MTFIDRLLSEAAKHRDVRRLFISRGEIRTDPEGARDKDADRPAAWSIADGSGVGWGCGNPGQHQIRVPATEWEVAFPENFRQALEAQHESCRQVQTAQDQLDDTRNAAIAAWEQTDRAKQLVAAVGAASKVYADASHTVACNQPEWVGRGQWFKVKHDATGS